MLLAYRPSAGANSPKGIGRASAHQFAGNGARAVYVCDFSSQHLATHKRELQSLYPAVDIHTRQFDASDEAAVKGVVDEAVETYGRPRRLLCQCRHRRHPQAFHRHLGR